MNHLTSQTATHFFNSLLGRQIVLLPVDAGFIMGEAFDAACKELHDTGQPELVHEVTAKRIIAAAQKDERRVPQLRDIALAGLQNTRNRL